MAPRRFRGGGLAGFRQRCREVRKAYNENGRRIGEGHPKAKYSDAEIDEVFRLSTDGIRIAEIARVLRMPRPTVAAILSGRRRSQSPDRIE